MLGIAIYPLATFFNHSCCPNVERSASYADGGETQFVALRDIAADEELTITYCDLSDDVVQRRDHLLRDYFFLCACERCSREAALLPAY